MYPESYRTDRRWYAGMTSFWDAALGNITDLVKEKGMWDNTLLVMTTDNGGPTYWTHANDNGTSDLAPGSSLPLPGHINPGFNKRPFPPIVPGESPGYYHGGGANNWPLKGSKVSLWEGGTRGASFISGGLVPISMRGTISMEKVHVADYYATFSYLAGVDPEDPNTVGTHSDGTQYHLPGVDSVNLWGFISGAIKTSPRTEVPICIDSPVMDGASALIVGDFKLLLGPQILAFWQGPSFPNGTEGEPYGTWPGQPGAAVEECGVADCPAGVPGCPAEGAKMVGGCLFNLAEDPNETKNIAKEMPEMLESLKQRYLVLKKDGMDQRTPLSKMAAATKKYVPNYVKMLKDNKGFVGPWCTDGACTPVAEDDLESSMVSLEGDFMKPPYGQGGLYPGMAAFNHPAAWQK